MSLNPCLYGVLIDFSGARIMHTSTNIRARVHSACGIELEELATLFAHRPVNTSSDAVLRGHSLCHHFRCIAGGDKATKLKIYEIFDLPLTLHFIDLFLSVD